MFKKNRRNHGIITAKSLAFSDAVLTLHLDVCVSLWNRVCISTRATYSKRGICYGNMVGWLAGYPVTRRYCIKTAKPILKLLRWSGSPHHSSFSDPCTDTQFQFGGVN